MHKNYWKIHALHKEECEGILNWLCYIQEKIDGANASVWNESGVLHCWSRTRDLTLAGDGFNGFIEYVTLSQEWEGIRKYLKEYPQHRLYGEWLVKHTINYNEVNYKHFYLFDIEDGEWNRIDINLVINIADEYHIKCAEVFLLKSDPTLDDIKRYAWLTKLWDKWEGVVIKNPYFINKFGNRQYAKYVTQDFKEDNAIVFGGNNKSSEKYCEQYYVNKFVSIPRVQKIMQKIFSSTDEKPDMKHIPRIMESVFYDVISEEWYTIAKEMAKKNKYFDFNGFKTLVDKKSKYIYIEILEWKQNM